MNKEEALQFLKEKIKTPNLIKHCLAVGAAMKELARYFHEDEKRWELAGLLHDIDYEETKDKPEEHSLLGSQWLKEKGLDKEITEAVKTHNPLHHLPPQSKMAKALFCADGLTGLIVASTLVLPSKKIKDLTKESVLRHFKDKSFARGVSRENISQCQPLLGLSLEEFVVIVLRGMQSIADDLGL